MNWPFNGKEKTQNEHRAVEQKKIQEERARKDSEAVDAANDSAIDDFHKNKTPVRSTVNVSDGVNQPLPEQDKQGETLKLDESAASKAPESNVKSETTNANEAGETLTNDEGDNVSTSAPGDGGAIQQEMQKDVLIDAEYIRAMYDAILENTKYSKNAAEEFETLVSMITDLSTGTVKQLGTTSTQLRIVEEELKRLKVEEVDRSKAVDRLARENSNLKDKCDGYDSIIKEKDDQIAGINGALKVSQKKCDEKDAEIAALNKARHDADIAHDEEMAKLKAAHDTEMADLSKKHAEEVEALNRNAADQIESVRKSVDEFVPARVCDLFDYRVGEPIDDRSRWQAIYAYLGFINGNLRQDAFVRRFREFDAALYDAMRDSPDQLAECRVRVQRHINEEVGKKAGGLLVCWPKAGEACNPDHYTTMSDFGQRISEVIGAMIYKIGDGGKVLCQSKGKVATA